MKRFTIATLIVLTLCIQQNHAAAGRFTQNIGRWTEQAGSHFRPTQWMRNTGPRFDAFTQGVRQSAKPAAAGATGLAGLAALQYLYNNPEIAQNFQQSMAPSNIALQQRSNYLFNMMPTRDSLSNLYNRGSNLYSRALEHDSIQRTGKAFNRMYGQASDSFQRTKEDISRGYQQARDSEWARRIRDYWKPQGEQ